MFTWTKSISTDCILIASDAVVKDELRMIALDCQSSIMKLVMKSIDDSIKAFKCRSYDKYNLNDTLKKH